MKVFTLQVEASFAATDIKSHHDWNKDHASWWFGDVTALSFELGSTVWGDEDIHYSGNLSATVIVRIDEDILLEYNSLDECLTSLGEDMLSNYLYHADGPYAAIFKQTLKTDDFHVYDWECEDYNPVGWANEVIEKNKA